MFTARLATWATSVLTTLPLRGTKEFISDNHGRRRLPHPCSSFEALQRASSRDFLFACYTCRFEHFPHVAWRCEGVLWCVRFALRLSLPNSDEMFE